MPDILWWNDPGPSQRIRKMEPCSTAGQALLDGRVNLLITRQLQRKTIVVPLPFLGGNMSEAHRHGLMFWSHTTV